MQPREQCISRILFACGWCSKKFAKLHSQVKNSKYPPCCSRKCAALQRGKIKAAARRVGMRPPPAVRGARWIPLTKGAFALVDVVDYERAIKSGPWSLMSKRGRPGARTEHYAARRAPKTTGRTIVYLHRLIMNEPVDKFVDHANRRTLDCRRKNLRVATYAESNRNRGKHAGNVRPYASKYKGVSNKRLFGTCTNDWEAFITVNNKTRTLGRFKSEAAAAKAYDAAAREHFGEFAALNFPRKGERSVLERSHGRDATEAEMDRAQTAVLRRYASAFKGLAEYDKSLK